MDAPAISAASLRQTVASARPPLVIDARKEGRQESHTWSPEAYK